MHTYHVASVKETLLEVPESSGPTDSYQPIIAVNAIRVEDAEVDG